MPSEVALGGLGAFVEKLKDQQRQNEEDTRLAIRRQAASGRRARADLDEAKAAVRELFERIKAIKSKAEQSEELVSDVITITIIVIIRTYIYIYKLGWAWVLIIG